MCGNPKKVNSADNSLQSIFPVTWQHHYNNVNNLSWLIFLKFYFTPVLANQEHSWMKANNR